MDLDAERIEAELRRLGATLGRPLSITRETGSTNDDARRAAAIGAPHGATFFADAQTRGRGRGGHAWSSPPGENIYMSMILRPELPAQAIAPITLVLGVAVARVVERALAGVRAASGLFAAPRVALKWPNDVFVGHQKISGVLVEGQLRGDRVGSLIAGIGLNVKTRAFPPELARRATSLALAGALDLDRSKLAAALIASVEQVASMYESALLAPFLDEICALDFLKGREVEIGGARFVAAGIDDAGRLLVRDENGVRSIASGEVTLDPL